MTLDIRTTSKLELLLKSQPSIYLNFMCDNRVQATFVRELQNDLQVSPTEAILVSLSHGQLSKRIFHFDSHGQSPIF
jgi:hypothetical protein